MSQLYRQYKAHSTDFWDQIHPDIRDRLAEMLIGWRQEVAARFTTAVKKPERLTISQALKKMTDGKPR